MCSDGKFGGVGSDVASDTALFVSCPIKCAEGEALVTVNHWTGDGIELEACARDAAGGDVGDCVPLPAADTPGPTLAAVKARPNMQIVLRAKSFKAPASMALIDDIHVDYKSCDGWCALLCDHCRCYGHWRPSHRRRWTGRVCRPVRHCFALRLQGIRPGALRQPVDASGQRRDRRA